MDKKTLSPEFSCGGHKWCVPSLVSLLGSVATLALIQAGRDLFCCSTLTNASSPSPSQEHPPLSDGQLERPGQRHGLGLPQLRRPEGERGVARLCPVRARHLEPGRPDRLHPVACVPCPLSPSRPSLPLPLCGMLTLSTTRSQRRTTVSPTRSRTGASPASSSCASSSRCPRVAPSPSSRTTRRSSRHLCGSSRTRPASSGTTSTSASLVLSPSSSPPSQVLTKHSALPATTRRR